MSLPYTQGTGRKLSTPVLFPAFLDMTLFLSSAVLRQRYGCRGGTPEASADAYELYAVICHKGNIQARTF